MRSKWGLYILIMLIIGMASLGIGFVLWRESRRTAVNLEVEAA
ncbi:hypothetical protein AB4Z30_02415 [Paenibacillus sp. 2TAF8]